MTVVAFKSPELVGTGLASPDEHFIWNETGLSTLNKPYMTYYGEVAYANLDHFALIANTDDDYPNMDKRFLKYIYFGSRFKDTDEWEQSIKDEILKYKNEGLGGVFLDECDIGYWSTAYYEDEARRKIFKNRMENVCRYADSIGMDTVCNGAREYIHVGTYWMWESFMYTWSTNKLNFHSGAPLDDAGGDASNTVTFGLDEWTLTGSLTFDGTSIRNGTDGTMSCVFDMSKYLAADAQKDVYDWVYFLWDGEGADDTTNTVWAQTSADGVTWDEAVQLWKGEPNSWDGIGKKAKYVKVEMRLKGAPDFRCDVAYVTYDYKYAHVDFTADVGAEHDADNQYYHNNITHLNFVLNAIDFGAKVLGHSYGNVQDADDYMFGYIAAKAFNFAGFDMCHPMHQTAPYTELTDIPLGAVIESKRTGAYTWEIVFEACTATLDLLNHTYTLSDDFVITDESETDIATDHWVTNLKVSDSATHITFSFDYADLALPNKGTVIHIGAIGCQYGSEGTWYKMPRCQYRVYNDSLERFNMFTNAFEFVFKCPMTDTGTHRVLHVPKSELMDGIEQITIEMAVQDTTDNDYGGLVAGEIDWSTTPATGTKALTYTLKSYVKRAKRLYFSRSIQSDTNLTFKIENCSMNKTTVYTEAEGWRDIAHGDTIRMERGDHCRIRVLGNERINYTIE